MITASLSRPSIEAPNSHCYRRLRELARACPCGCVPSVGGVFLVWPGRKKQGPRGMPRGCFQDPRSPPPPSKTPPKSRYWLKCISPKLTAKGGHRPGQLLSGIRRTDAFPANPGWGLAQESPANWSTAPSGPGTTGPTPRRGSISKISAPRSAPRVYLCQKLL